MPATRHYRALVGMLLAALSAVSAPVNVEGHAVDLGRRIVTRPPALKADLPTRPAAPTQKMLAEQERLAGATRSRAKFDIYRKRLYNRRTLAALTKEAAQQARLRRLFA